MAQSAASRTAILLGRRIDDDDEGFGNPGLFAMSVRLPSPTASLVAAMADQAGCSRNELLNLIVEAGIDAIFSATAPEVVDDLRREAEANISDFIS